MEWLRSPIVYIERFDTAARLRSITPEYYSPASCAYNMHVAKVNYRDYLKWDIVWLNQHKDGGYPKSCVCKNQ